MKASNFIKTLALLSICFVMLGCSAITDEAASEQMTDIRILESATLTPIPLPTETAAPSFTPTAKALATSPAPTPVLNASDLSAQLKAIDLAVFIEYVTSNGYTLQQSLYNPSSLDIEKTNEFHRWESITESSVQEKAKWASDRLIELQSIDREQLTERDSLIYDTLEYYLNATLKEEELFYYQEFLTPNDGVQTEILSKLAQYRLKTEEDIASYFLLLQDVPRYFSEILLHEQKRAELGLFMTKHALEGVVSDCSDIIKNEKNLFIKDVFSNAVNEIENVTRDQRKEYIEQHNTIIKETLIPAYEHLKDGLEVLSEHCRSEQGMYVLGDLAMKQYAHALSNASASDITPDDALALLDTALSDLHETMHTIYADDPSVEDLGKLTGKSTVSKLMSELRTISEEMLPKLSEDALFEIKEVPKSLADVYPAAQHIIPPIDRSEEPHVILLNPHTDDDIRLLTLAHEGWPGQLFQYAYQGELVGLGYMQQVLPLKGYYEGWAYMAEEWLLLEQNKYDQNAAMFVFANNMLSDAIIPSAVSILVNYYGYEKDDVRDYLTQYGLQEDAYVDLYFDYAVTRPFSALGFGIGYAQMAAFMRDMSATMGADYLQKTVQTRFLDYGPSYFHLIRERMDEWVDTKMPE